MASKVEHHIVINCALVNWLLQYKGYFLQLGALMLPKLYYELARNIDLHKRQCHTGRSLLFSLLPNGKLCLWWCQDRGGVYQVLSTCGNNHNCLLKTSC